MNIHHIFLLYEYSSLLHMHDSVLATGVQRGRNVRNSSVIVPSHSGGFLLLAMVYFLLVL